MKVEICCPMIYTMEVKKEDIPELQKRLADKQEFASMSAGLCKNHMNPGYIRTIDGDPVIARCERCTMPITDDDQYRLIGECDVCNDCYLELLHEGSACEASK